MNRDETIKEVAHRLGNRKDIDSKILKALDYSQRFIMERYPILPWFLITENLSTTTIPGQSRLQVPAGFLREVEKGALWRQVVDDGETTWVELKKGSQDVLQASMGGETLKVTGAPTHYDITGDYWILYPAPDAEYEIFTRVYQRDQMASELSSGGESNKWMTYEWEFLVTEAVLRLARHLQWEPRILSEFRTDRDEARRNFFTNEEARTHANHQYQMAIVRGI